MSQWQTGPGTAVGLMGAIALHSLDGSGATIGRDPRNHHLLDWSGYCISTRVMVFPCVAARYRVQSRESTAGMWFLAQRGAVAPSPTSPLHRRGPLPDPKSRPQHPQSLRSPLTAPRSQRSPPNPSARPSAPPPQFPSTTRAVSIDSSPRRSNRVRSPIPPPADNVPRAYCVFVADRRCTASLAPPRPTA